MNEKTRDQMKIKNKLGTLGIPCLSVATVTAFPAVFLYCRNAAEASFSEIVPFLVGSMAVGIAILIALVVLIKKPEKAALVTSIFMLLMLNFYYVESAMKLVLPNLKYWHIVPIVVVVMLHIAYVLLRFLKDRTACDASMVLCLVFGGLIIINVVTAAPQIIGYARGQIALKASKESQINETNQMNSDMPNVYLLIFDEYANFPQMEECYDYDNAPLKDFLEEYNFNISYTSHNESIRSYTVQTNMASLDYVVDDSTTTEEKNALRKNGVLFNVMREHGYSVRILESGDFYGGSMPEGRGGNVSATTMYGENMETLLCRKTILYPLFLQSNMQLVQDYNTISNYIIANAEEIQNTFTLAYYDFPHPPFIVDENGKDLKAGGFAGPETWKNKTYYLGQFKYTTKLMLSVLEGIIDNDPKAVILLMSDHGARGTLGAKYDMKTNSLNAMYYQGESRNIEGLSNVNTLRFALNCLFNLDYKMVPVPE